MFKKNENINDLIKRKPALKQFYINNYQRYINCLKKCPKKGYVLELGSGYGFVKEFSKDIITSDIKKFPGTDRIENAMNLSFENNSLKAILMINVFHHLPDPARFLSEASRCLIPGGRILIIDHYPGLISKPIFKWLHNEPWNVKTKTWSFNSKNYANSALAWVVFIRDRQLLNNRFPNLSLARITTHSPIIYWLSGGLKSWNLIPTGILPALLKFEETLLNISPHFGSFMDIELIKTKQDSKFRSFY